MKYPVTAARLKKYRKTITVAFISSFLTVTSAAYAADNMRVKNLPDELVGLFDPSQYADTYNAANSLIHLLENKGYPLALITYEDNTLFVDLGRIESISVQGINDKTAHLAKSYLKQLLNTTPHIENIDHVSGLVQDIPGLTASLHFNRIDSGNTYEAILVGSEISQAGSISIHNTPTTDLSGREVVIHQEFYSGFIGGDILRFELAGAQEEGDGPGYFGEISYQAPINDIGSFAEARLSHYDSPSNFQFTEQRNTDTHSTAMAIMLGHRFKRTVNTAETGYLEIDYRIDDDHVAEQQESGVTRASWFYKHNSDHGDTLSFGTTLSGGRYFTGNEDSFGSLRAGMGWIKWLPALSQNAEMLVEVSGQLGTEDQPSYELLSFGGQSKQRGFTPFEYAGSSGANLTFELGDTFYPKTNYVTGVSPYAFVDASYLDNSSGEASSNRPESVELVSTGVGARITLQDNLSIHSWLAIPVVDSEKDRSNGPEFYIQMQYSW